MAMQCGRIKRRSDQRVGSFDAVCILQCCKGSNDCQNIVHLLEDEDDMAMAMAMARIPR